MKILVFDVQRYSTRDGPGIRTTVFLKGCNMRCVWCENPESISSSPQISFATERCIRCKNCVMACPFNAISINSGYPIDRTLCNTCGACVAACPTNTLNLIGTWQDVDELVSQLLLDRDYWSGSGGGVTISGGEASTQVEALRELLAELHRQNVHTVLQTNGNMAWEKLELITRDVDLIHFDLKGISESQHRMNTETGNKHILSNAGRLSESNYPVVFRVPLIPGYNDSPEDLLDLRNFLDDIGARSVDILPYHNLGHKKLNFIGIEGNELSLASMRLMDARDKAGILESAGRVVTVSSEPS